MIPGQMTQAEQAELARACSRVVSGGCAVEVGSLYGLSSHIIASSIPGDAILYCIDPWKREPWIIELVETKIQDCPPFSKDAFHQFTANCLNIVALQGYSPKDFLDWNLQIDLIFEDSIHENPILNQNLTHWKRHVRPGGTICGHDYCSLWPDVMFEADKLAREFNTALNVTDSFWWLRI